MLNDLITSAKETLLDRLTSPLIGSFVLAWPLWNYKFVVILLSSNSVTVTFQLIETIAFRSGWEVAWRGVLAPLASALAYVFLYPYPATWVFRFVRRHQANLNRIKLEIEGAELMSLNESRLLRASIRTRIDSLEARNESLENEKQHLARINTQLEEELRVLRAEAAKESAAANVEPEKVDLETLKAVGAAEDQDKVSLLSILAVVAHTRKSRTQTLYLLDRLVALGFVEQKGDHFQLTARGRKVHAEINRAA